MTGPATNAATIATVWKIMGRRVALLYLGTVAVCAIGAGLLLDALFFRGGIEVATEMPSMLPPFVKVASAAILIAVVAGTFFKSSKVGEETMQDTDTERMRIEIEGMTCEHCARSIHRALMEVEGVESAEVDFRKGEAIVAGHRFDIEAIAATIEDLGYKFVGSFELE